MNKTFSMSIRVSEEELQKLKQAARIESYASFTKSQDENMINRIYEYAKRINKI